MLKNLLRKAMFGSAGNFQVKEQFGFEVRDDTGKLVTPGYVWTHNRVVDQGLNYLLNAAFFSGATIQANWYIAPFAANVTPAANVTAQNFASTLTEFTNYTEANRPIWTPDAAATAMELINNAAPSLFTIGAGPQTSIYGGGLLSASAKSSTSGVCAAAGKLANPLTGLAEGFEVRLKYRLRASSNTP